MTTNLYILIFTLLFIVADIVTGIIKAIKNKDFSSAKMREGLIHKSSYVFIIAVAGLIEYAGKYVNLGFTLPLVPISGVYVILTEIGSIVENIIEINPEIAPGKLKELFAIKDTLNKQKQIDWESEGKDKEGK